MFRPADSLLGGTPFDDLQLKVYLGMIEGAYLRGLEVVPFIDSRVITTGKSWQLPMYGYSDSGKHHVVGESILLDSNYRQQIPFMEKLMYVDQPYVINTFIPDWEEMQTHYETRSVLMQGFGERHARHSDYLACRALIKAARSAANIPVAGSVTSEMATVGGSSNGTGAAGQAAPAACDNASMLTDGDVLVAALFAAAQRLDEQDAPTEGRIALLRPSQYYALVTNRQLLDRDVVRDNGDFADGTVFKCANIRLVKSNAIATAAVNQAAAATGEIVSYTGDFTDNAGIVFHRDAALRLIRQSMEVNAWEEKERFGWVLSTRRIDGYNVKRPEAAVELTV